MIIPLSLAFEMTDDVAARATRENWLAQGRRLFTPGTLVLVAVTAVIFLGALRGDSHWLWVGLTGTPPVLLAIMVIVWAGGLWWAPRAARRKLVRLPNRRVTVELTEAALVLETANERLAVKWIEARELRPLPSFWVLVLGSGAEIPLPREAVSAEAVETLRGLMPAS